MVDISHTTGDPTQQDASIMDFLRALATDAGALGKKMMPPMRGDGTRAANKGMSSVPTPTWDEKEVVDNLGEERAEPSPYENIGMNPDDFAMSGIGRSPDDGSAPLSPYPQYGGIGVHPQDNMPNVPQKTMATKRPTPRVPVTSAPAPSSIMEGANSSSESTIPPLLLQFWKMMQRTPTK